MNSRPMAALALLLACLLLAPTALEAASHQRSALVIGNSAYKASPLANPVNDANDMAELLKKLGFHVTKLTDASRRDMEEAINALGRRLREGGTGLFYFAGHGVQVNGINYLIPIGANIETEGDVKFEAVDANRVLSKMQDAGNPLNTVFLDACRNNPFARMFRSAQQGLAPMDAPKGSLVAFATAPGDTAADGMGRNGVFTKHLLENMPQPGLEIGLMMRQVRAGVQTDTGDKQTPFEVSSLTGSFYFNTASKPSPKEPVAPPSVVLPPQPSGATDSGIGDYEAVLKERQAAMERWTAWQERMGSEFAKAEGLCQNALLKPEEKADIWSRFLSAWGDDNPYSRQDEDFRTRAQNEQDKWKSQPFQILAMGKRPAPPAAEGPGTWTEPSTGMEFVWVPKGCFRMGSTDGEPDEKPVHEVCVDGFWMGKYEVIQAEWREVMGSNPSKFKGDRNPVEQVSWEDAQAFIQKLNASSSGTGKLRLPTEAEWEYAARSGGREETYAGGDDLDRVGWYDKNSGGETHPVGGKAPNGLGLYDMSGNVWEWCADWKGEYSSGKVTNPTGPAGGSWRVNRGGGWNIIARGCRAAFRGNLPPRNRFSNLGFRLVRTIP